jgi:hypothetical protein
MLILATVLAALVCVVGLYMNRNCVMGYHKYHLVGHMSHRSIHKVEATGKLGLIEYDLYRCTKCDKTKRVYL